MIRRCSRPIQKCLSIFILLISLGVVFAPAITADSQHNDVYLEKDDNKMYWLWSDSGDDVEINFSLDLGGNVDVYIMTSDEYWDRYVNDTDFHPAMSWVNVRAVKETWEQPDDQAYRIVIDNWDNAKNNDTVPTGDVQYDLFYDDKLDEKIDEILGMAGMALAGCCLLIIIVIVVVIWLIVRKKNSDTVVIQTPGGYPPMGPPGYQPQGPPQQQPQYQPGPPQQPPQYQPGPPQFNQGPPMGQPVQPAQPPQYQPPPAAPMPPPIPPPEPPTAQIYTPPTPPPIPQPQYKGRPPTE
jgi:hypothetical protein